MKKTNRQAQENYRPNEVAQYLSVSISIIWKYAKKGKLKPIHLSPGVTIFRKADVDAFIDSCAKEKS